MRKRKARQNRCAYIAIIVLAASLLAAGAAAAPHPGGKQNGKGKKGAHPGPIGGSTHGPSARLSRHRVRPSGRWRGYVIDSRSPFVYPRGVEVAPNVDEFGEPGGVQDPDGLKAADGRLTTIFASKQGTPYLVLDLGIVTGGRVQIAVTANSGVPIRLAYSEARRFLFNDGDINHGSQGRNDDPSARVDLLPAGPGTFTLAGVRGSQRYVLLQLEGPGSVQIDYLRVAVNHLRPKPHDYVGHFLSSDDLLNRIWYAGAYTLNLTTFGDPRRGNAFAVADGAKHDRLVWLGDLPMEYLIGAYTVRQLPAILKRSIQLFTCQQEPGGYIPKASDTHVECRRPGPANGPPPAANGTCICVTDRRLPEYTAWFIIAAAEHYRYSGDETVREWLPVIRRAINFFSSQVDGLGLFLTGPDDINWHVPDIAPGEDAHTNAVWVRALREAASLERSLGSRGRGRRYARRARRLAGALRAVLFDPAVRALRVNPADPSGNHPQDANVEAVLAGVLNGADAEAALGYLQYHLGTPFGTATGEFDNDPYQSRYISPYMSGWELIARFERHHPESALSLTRRLWGHMVRSDPGTTMWEKMTVDGGVAPYQRANQDGSPISETPLSGETSLAHGWSGAPTAALSAYVLGMRPIGPGWSSWLIEPQVGDLQFAQGQVGTPQGKLASRWKRGAGRPDFRLTIRAPAGAEGTVAVPLLGAGRTIARDGRVVWQGKHPVGGARAHQRGGYVRFHEEEPGTHTYAWAKKG